MADLARPDLLKQAKAERQERIKKLRSCECAWPITRYRNGDGHHPECPAHAQPNAAPEHVHNFEFRDWSYNEEREFEVCDCGVKRVPPSAALDGPNSDGKGVVGG